MTVREVISHLLEISTVTLSVNGGAIEFDYHNLLAMEAYGDMEVQFIHSDGNGEWELMLAYDIRKVTT